MLGTVDSIDYDGDRVRKVVLRFPALRSGDAEVVKEVQACERIGQGSFGTVYRAVCDDYPRLALKIATGKATRLRQELDVLSRVCTKGRLLLPRFEFGALNKTMDLIVVGMELCVPSTLHDLLLSTRITSEAEMLFMAYQVVQSVSYVHAEHCIHRDIKLQNFVFDLDGNLKLIDFGLACTSLKPPPGDVVAGTVSFMSPEMAHNALHKDKRVSVGVAADVWSLGIVLFSIFTQRNPYPTAPETPAPAEASSSGAAVGTDATSAAEAAKGNGVAQQQQQQRMNERLLRRVAAGDWQWPVGVTVSQDLRQLVNCILVPNPDERPTVERILANKLWNLRRRYPPAAVAAFLGVQDDVLLSHDEAHLMRAVEERSAGVAASLRTSRLHSPASPSGDDNGDTDAQQSSSGSGGDLHAFGTSATTPARSSLRVVQRGGEGGEGGVDGTVAVQVYDVRASTRKHSKPIREISVVMAEETAKARRSKSARRAKSAASATAALVDSRAPSAEGDGRRASSAGVTLRGDRRAVAPVRLQAELNTADYTTAAPEEVSALAGEAKAIEPACVTPPQLVRDVRRSVGRAASSGGERRAVSEELLEGTEPPPPLLSSEPRAMSSGGSRRRGAGSLHQPSSSILRGVVRASLSSVASVSAAAASASRSVSRPARRHASLAMTAHESAAPSRQTSLRRPTAAPDASAGGTASSGAPVPVARRGSPPLTRTQRMALELSLDVVWQDEADRRRALSAMLLLEHAWLLASFRLTIVEDQERYNITWLAEEQEKSAAHPHRFKEVTKVLSKKYQYGFVCDMCDYEFLPTGPNEKDLHYFHCPCGRDLCPECYTTYQRQCTCACCRMVHPNSCVLREHLLQTGGTQLGCAPQGRRGRGSVHPTAHLVLDDEGGEGEEEEAGRRGGAAAAAPPPPRRGRPPQQGKSGDSSTAQRRSSRAAKDGQRRRRPARDASDVDEDEADEVARIRLPRMSIAAMHQQEVSHSDSGSGGGSRRGGTSAAGTAAWAVQRPEDVEVRQRTVEAVPEGPWRPFARFKKDRRDEAARQPAPEERDALLNGEWIRHFYLFPHHSHASSGGTTATATAAEAEAEEEEPYAFVYHAQPGRTGAVFLTSDFAMHSAVFSMLERQFFVVDRVDTVDGADVTRATSLLKAKGLPDLRTAFQALQDIVAYDTNSMKQQRTPGTVSVYQAPRSAYSCNSEPFLYVRWFRFNEDRSLSAFLLSNGAVQVFVHNEYELRWFDETRKFLIRYNGVCELVDDSTFALTPAINHLLYDSFDT
ncbi:kinetoplastid kinetochore protein 3 [Novymonas esmeraldas]|uniref:Kinetoplastid kinetochore protein 3 n=1 Tax=Novymonas esmeraldas TaxID=1808958 RepID=A0AAW0F2Q9_9TRYP